MWQRNGCGGAPNRKFFRRQLISSDSLKELLKQAFILVYKLRFSLKDVYEMTLQERNHFFEFFAEDVEAQNDIIKRN